MRASTEEGDAGYTKESPSLSVYLDGVKLTSCFTADEELGEAHCYAKDESGELIRDGDELKRVILRGDVRIVKE